MSPEESGSLSLSPNRLLRLLSQGDIEVEGLIPWSSNATLLVTVRENECSSLAIYKPLRGERPLWDFPRGTLGKREVAAYMVSEALGWGLVPPTVLRVGPYGLGSLQSYVNAQEELHYFTIQDDRTYSRDLMHLAAFDVVTNNADRKSGHCLVDDEGRLWAIDNALTFHTVPKLRTVIWDFAEQPLPLSVREGLQRLGSALTEGMPLTRDLAEFLLDEEMTALRHRVDRLIKAGHYPSPGPGRPVPWPLV